MSEVEKGSARIETALGWWLVEWTDTGISRVVMECEGGAENAGQTNEERRSGVEARFESEGEREVPRWVRDALAAIRGHLNGTPKDMTRIPVDLGGVSPFCRRVYEATRALRAGQTATYGEIARSVRSPRAARAVGQALARNPVAIVVPCHRVVAANGRPGGFSAPGGRATKLKLLALEGVVNVTNPVSL